MSANPDWMGDAYCRVHDIPTSVFYPEDNAGVAVARVLCAECDVRQDCLDHALDNGEEFGIWGGVSERGRRALLRRRRPPRRAA